jgi:hypothetical protein
MSIIQPEGEPDQLCVQPSRVRVFEDACNVFL